MKKLFYTINSEKIDGDFAIVNIKVNGPDMATAMLDYIQQVFSNGLTQAFSTSKLTEEQSKKMDDDILSKCIDNIKYTDRTEDISLTKKDGKWEIVTNDALMTLLINMRGSYLNSDMPVDEYAFQVLDDEGNVLGGYPVYDDNRTPKKVPVGGKCKASVTFGVPTESINLNVTFTRGSEKVAKIVVPIK